MNKFAYIVLTAVLIGAFCATAVSAADVDEELPLASDDLGRSREAGRTDDEVVQREEEAIKLDGLNVAQMRELHEKSEKHVFQAEVDRMMKLIINSLYKNKEIFLRELISNASDALDKVRFLSLTDETQLAATEELTIRIRANAESRTLHIIDTGIGMTRDELVKNLGTIAKSGTSDFFEKYSTAQSTDEAQNLIGQFGVGFYSAFLVADHVTVISKHNSDDQYIWESDTREFSVVKDPRGTTLKRGTEVILRLKEEASEFLETEKLKELVQKYSQFMNFNIYLWTKKTEMVDEPIDEEAPKKSDETEDEEARVEEEKKDEAKTKKVEKTTWDWELLNDTKPIWVRKPADVPEEEYHAFYKAITKDTEKPLAYQHFKAEGEVSFTSILYVPTRGPQDMFQNYGKLAETLKLYVRRVFITDQFDDMMPKYLAFVRGVLDSDDLPLNVSRETLQQNKLLKVIKKKLVRKVLDMIKKLSPEEFETFWKEFSTNIKLGVIEDQSNRTRLANLLRFRSSFNETGTTLSDYVSRMKDKQTEIYYMAGTSLEEAKKSPFVERLLRRGLEVLYLTEPVDEYCINALPEYESKKFANVAKEDLKIAGADSAAFKERQEALEKEYKPLTDWLKDNALNGKIEKAILSNRLAESPCALVASQYGWTGNMERIMRSQAYSKPNDAATDYYLSQKKTLEINPRHPVIKELLRRVNIDPEERNVKDMAYVLFETAALRSGYLVRDSTEFSERVERLLRAQLDVPYDEKVEEDPLDAEAEADAQKAAEEVNADGDFDDTTGSHDHDHDHEEL